MRGLGIVILPKTVRNAQIVLPLAALGLPTGGAVPVRL
jgi:hypothetical protein